MLPDHCSTRGVLTQHVPTLTVMTRSTLHAAISSGDSSSSTPMISMLQQHFNITLPSFLPSHCTYVINRRDTVPERTAWTKAEGNIWGRVGEAAAWRWREPRQRVRMPEGSFFQQACGSPGEIVMLILHLLCIKADENIKQQEGGTQKWKEHEGKKMQAWQEEESPDGAGGEKGNPCLWAPWLSSLAWKTSADKRSLLFCPGSNKNISCFFLLEKREIYACGCGRCLGSCTCLGEAHFHPCEVPGYCLRALTTWLCLLCQFKEDFTFLNIQLFYRGWSIFREASRGSQFPETLLKNSALRLF